MYCRFRKILLVAVYTMSSVNLKLETCDYRCVSIRRITNIEKMRRPCLTNTLGFVCIYHVFSVFVFRYKVDATLVNVIQR